MASLGFFHRLSAVVLVGLCACATPAERAANEATKLGFPRQILFAKHFLIVAYPSQSEEPASVLHVYLEGDGSPRSASRYRPPDPTPEDPLVLRLMALDPRPSVLLARPCTHGAPPCDPWYWTLGRFGEEVVETMVLAVQQLRLASQVAGVVLIGHSGGGALAMLMAERIPETRAVITLAGNLDLEAWAAHHGYTRLWGSLDPARRPPLAVAQIHLLAGRDRSVPPELTEKVIDRQPHARTRLFPDFDHSCCWASVWPSVLAELERDVGAGPSPAR